MYQKFLITLAIVLVAVAPVWNYSSNWSYGPFIAVLCLLLFSPLVAQELEAIERDSAENEKAAEEEALSGENPTA